MNEMEIRTVVVRMAASFMGANEHDGSYWPIIDLYNRQRPLPRGYALNDKDEWCAAFVSAVGYACGFSDIIHPECGCEEMIKLYKAEGRWVEDDAYRPLPGDIIMYNWQGKPGANVGVADHVGIVEAVTGNAITVIEGNKGRAVSRRQIPVEYVYTRGFCLPDYASKATDAPVQDKPWNVAARDWAMARGITDGSRPKDPATREEVWAMLQRREGK